MKKMIALVLSAMLLTLSVSAAGSVPSVGAKSVILMDRRTGTVLYEENADGVMSMHSSSVEMILQPEPHKGREERGSVLQTETRAKALRRKAVQPICKTKRSRV